MKKQLVSFALVIFISWGCGKSSDSQNTGSNTTNNSTNQTSQQYNTQQNTQTPPSSTDGKATEEKTATQNTQQQTNTSSGRDQSGAIIVKFPVGSTQVTLNGTIKGFGEQIAYVFEVSKGQKLTASVVPVPSNGNIRIGQIISPSGNSDGPFGNQMTYDLNEAGNWKLILSENQMAGDPWEGQYNLTIGIK
ncbi:MAG TPA: hypothetical protein VHP32_11610 [Ignavibacteria bacterium]|nr:hypothetical protein [Ignavibacteria bacterium]